MKLISIPASEYEEYRLDVIFDGYKWDPQFLDNNTIAKHVLVITEQEHAEIKALTEKLTTETLCAENILNKNLDMAKPLGLTRQIRKCLPRMSTYNQNQHVRLMRYDFHPITNGGWAISEVNSDVPGGFAEASLMPAIAKKYLRNNNYWYPNFGDFMVDAITKIAKKGAKIMFVHCTSYSDDRQPMQYLGDRLEQMGYQIIYAAADHLIFENNIATSILSGNEGEVDVIFRFTPLEWLVGIKPKNWHGYFDTKTASCNHPIAIFAQTKRFPLVWNQLEKMGVSLMAWRELLPETLKVKDAKGKSGFIYKPACGRVGEGISIKEACREGEYEKIMKAVRRYPKSYVAQRKFDSNPLQSPEGETFHVCLGAYSVNDKHAGYYARISKSARIDSRAADIPVLIEGNRK